MSVLASSKSNLSLVLIGLTSMGVTCLVLVFTLVTTAHRPAEAVPQGWQVIVHEDFEGDFPTGLWQIHDGNGSAGGEYFWAKRDCKPSENDGGAYSAWAVGGGDDGRNLACGQNYRDSANSWMIYGPFDLTDATAAEVIFDLWVDTEEDDVVTWGASTDGETFGWQQPIWGNYQAWFGGMRFDLARVPDLGSLTGQPRIWLAFHFVTNADGKTAQGVFVDNVTVRAHLGPRPTPTPIPTATLSLTPTSSPTPTGTTTPLPGATASPSPTGTATPAVTPMASSTPTPSSTPSPTLTSTPSHTTIVTYSPSPTATGTATLTATSTLSPSPSPGSNATVTNTPEVTPTPDYYVYLPCLARASEVVPRSRPSYGH